MSKKIYFHIHVDAQDPLEPDVIKALEEIGFEDDSFDHGFRAVGKDGKPDEEFPHYEPLEHKTFMTSRHEIYEKKWNEAVGIMRASRSRAYLEGELIIFGRDLENLKPFERVEYEKLFPITAEKADYYDPESLAFKLEDETRSLPMKITTRRLIGKEKFRYGEVHLTLPYEGTEPRLLNALYNMGFSAPAIPRLKEDGLTVREIPLTLQVMDIRDAVKIAHVAVTIINRVGGASAAWVKIENIFSKEFFNGIDRETGIPPVVASIKLRDDFKNIPPNKVGNFDCNLTQLVGQMALEAEFKPKLRR